MNIQNSEEVSQDVNIDIKTLTGQINVRSTQQNPTPESVAETNRKKAQKGTLQNYKNIMNDYFRSINYLVGRGMNNTRQLIDRLKLLGGSIMAGNSGVVPEFTRIARYLNSIKVLPTSELQDTMSNMRYYLGFKSDGQEKSTKILISWKGLKNKFLFFFVHR